MKVITYIILYLVPVPVLTFLTSYGSGSTIQKVPVPQRCAQVSQSLRGISATAGEQPRPAAAQSRADCACVEQRNQRRTNARNPTYDDVIIIVASCWGESNQRWWGAQRGPVPSAGSRTGDLVQRLHIVQRGRTGGFQPAAGQLGQEVGTADGGHQQLRAAAAGADSCAGGGGLPGPLHGGQHHLSGGHSAAGGHCQGLFLVLFHLHWLT
jgi:hypothetical protein